MGNDRRGPVAEGPRENDASFFIQVQILAGPPAFAAAQLRLGKPAQKRPVPPKLEERRRKPKERRPGLWQTPPISAKIAG
jgi:hypothetical protein